MTPDSYTNQELMLKVGDGHQLYVQDWGLRTANKPIVFLHGGPGGGVKDRHKNNFDPELQRVIFFDQRGSGRSLPYGSLEHNTTDDLTEDIEKIADNLKLEKFILTGGSWGSCLALAYAIKHPERIMAMVLRGIFTASKIELEWFEKGGFSPFFPDVWQTLLDGTPKAHQDDPVNYHYQRILGNDTEQSTESAYLIGNVEGALLSLDDRYSPPDRAEFDPTFVRLETHYMANKCFLPPDYILRNAAKLTMPVWLIQGRYDMVCPPVTAYELNELLPNSRLIWTVAGHGNDRGNYDVSRTILLQLAGAGQ